MVRAFILLMFSLMALAGCTETSSPDNHEPGVVTATARSPQVFSAKVNELVSTDGKVLGDMLLAENGDLHVAQLQNGKLVWVKSETFKTTTSPQKGDRGSKFFIGKIASEITTDKMSGDLLVDRDTADVYAYNGAIFSFTGLNLRGLKGDKGESGAQGTAGTDGTDGKDGRDGTNGSSCSATKNGTVTTISCTDGTSSSVVDGKDGANGADGSGSGSSPSLLTKEYIILKASRDPQKNTTSPVNFNSDATKTLVLPEALQVTYGNAGNATARICVNGNCCIYKGGADVESPLNPGYLNQWTTPTSRNDLLQIEKGRQYRFQSCSTGGRTVTIQQYQNLYIGVDYGDPSMMTEVTATIEVK